MVKKGEQAVLVGTDLALSDVSVKKGDEAVVHDDDLARGPSSVKQGQEAVLVADDLAQTAGGLPEYIRLGDLRASDQLLYIGDTVTLTLPVTNEDSDTAHDFTVPWYENQSQFASTTKTIDQNSTVEYTKDVTKNNAGKFNYQGSQSNVVAVTWLNVRPGPLTADPYVLNPGQTSTLSITVDNPGSDPVDLKVEFFNGQDTDLAERTATLSAGGSQTFTLDRTFDFAAEVDYYVKVTEVNTGVSGVSQTVTVKWTSADILADWGDGIKPINPLNVSDAESWYDYYDGRAHHPNLITWATSITALNEDGSGALPVAVTHHDASKSSTTDTPYSATTDFTFNHGSFGSYLLKDDPESSGTDNTTYSTSDMYHEWNGNKTDGAVLTIPKGTDMTFYVTGTNSDHVEFFTGDRTEYAGLSVRIINNR